MPGDSESGTVHSYLRNLLSGLDVTNVYSHVFTCTCQQNSIMRETDGSDWPFQPWECLDAGQLIGIPNTDKSICWSSGEVSATPAKFYADAVARMSLKQHIQDIAICIWFLFHIKYLPEAHVEPQVLATLESQYIPDHLLERKDHCPGSSLFHSLQIWTVFLLWLCTSYKYFNIYFGFQNVFGQFNTISLQGLKKPNSKLS